MKRVFLTTIILIAFLALSTGTAFAGSVLELLSVQNNAGGPTFTFRVNGEFSQSELQGFVQVEGGDSFPLYCSQTTSDEVVCHTSKKVGGHNVVVGIGGARFWTFVKEKTSFCAPVFDWNGYPNVNPDANDNWAQIGRYCSEEELNGRIIFTQSNGTFWSYSYFSAPGSTDGIVNEIWAPAGPGYYFP